MTATNLFYDQYHQKNNRFRGIIKPNNFTYFYILDWLQQPGLTQPLGHKVLDVGCGVGTMSLYLSSQGAKVEGIDVSKRAINIAENARQAVRLEDVQFKQQLLAKGRNNKDLVVCFEVLEHVPAEDTFLQLIASHLKPDGKLVLSTPSFENTLYRLGYYRRFDAEVGHLRRYNPAVLTELLEKNGFEVLALRKVEGPLRNILFTSFLGKIIRFIRGPLVPIFHFFDRLSGAIFGFADLQIIAQLRKT